MMRFRGVELDVTSAIGRAGFTANFHTSRLFVVQGDNSVGKSLLIQSLVYGLGLEGAFGPGRQHGLLTRAMSDAIDLNGRRRVPVISSSVTVEIENAAGEILTVRRGVR